MDNLYFIALLPDEELRQTIHRMKLDFRDRFGAKHALKSPPHITLQMPVKRSWEEEGRISQHLRKFASELSSIDISLKGFGAFPKRVIYIDVANPDPIRQVHQKLRKLLRDQLDFEPNETEGRFNPHITLATRDLNDETFEQAWPQYQKRSFVHIFRADAITLLRHNGKFWDVYQNFSFGR